MEPEPLVDGGSIIKLTRSFRSCYSRLKAVFALWSRKTVVGLAAPGTTAPGRRASFLLSY